MFNAWNISKDYGARPILCDASLTIRPGERIGLVGRNGCGKTTLMRILAGAEAPDRGTVTRPASGLSIGYLSQHAAFPTGASGEDVLLQGLPPSVPAWEARKAASGLGIGASQLRQEASSLSGGEKTRLMLARLLVARHDLLLLDEPTSHLDIPMLEQLESTLTAYRGAFLVVSHDRRFLDCTVNRILELDDGRLRSYAGGYTDYAEAKRQAVISNAADYLDQQRQIRALRQFIARQLGWAARSQSGPKRGRDHRGHVSQTLARRAHAAEKRIEQIEKIEKTRQPESVNVSLSPKGRSGQSVFEARDIAKWYGARPLFRNLDLYVNYGERIGVIGPNGAGKTTLIRILLGLEPPSEGSVHCGAGLVPLYLAQEQEQLAPEQTVLETVEAVGGLTQTEARTLLACFLFREHEIFTKVKDLSGGERSRLGIAGAVVSGANLLVLDEPTNFLDIDTRERLEDAIAAYGGTLIVVSHDRFLLDRLCRRTLAIIDGRVDDYPGPYSEWAAGGRGMRGASE